MSGAPRTLSLPGGDVALREWGDEGATALVFWHSVGPGGSGEMLAVAAPPLVEAGVRVLAPDAPGFGRSPAREADAYALDSLARLMWGVADAVGAERPVLAGHSWGGAVAVAAAGLRPDDVRALVLFDSGHVDYADWPGADVTATREQLTAAAAEDVEAGSWGDLVAILRENVLDQEWTLAAWREAVDELEDGSVRLRVAPSVRGAALYELTHARQSAVWPAIASAGIPTLLLLATEPPEIGEANEEAVARFEAAVPQAEVLRLAGCRHQIFADLGGRSGELVAAWLRERGLV